MQNTKFIQYNTRFRSLFSSKWISSKQSVTLDAKIRTRINHSKIGVSMYCKIYVRKSKYFIPNLVFKHFSIHENLKNNIISYFFLFINYINLILFITLLRKAVLWHLRSFSPTKARKGHWIFKFTLRVSPTSNCYVIYIGNQAGPRFIVDHWK